MHEGGLCTCSRRSSVSPSTMWTETPSLAHRNLPSPTLSTALRLIDLIQKTYQLVFGHPLTELTRLGHAD